MADEKEERKKYIEARLMPYREVFAKAAVGDFSGLAPIPGGRRR